MLFLTPDFDLVLEQPVSVPLIAGAYAVLMSIIIVYGVINFVIERLFERARLMRAVNDPPEPEEGEPKDDSESERPFALHQMTSFEELARRVSGIIAFVVGAYALLRIWDQQEMVLRDSIVDRTLDVVVIIFIGYIVYHAFRIWIDNKIADETMDAPEAELGDEGGASSASRLATLLPLFRNFILVVVVVSIGLIALLEVGINVSPLFAGAGVVADSYDALGDAEVLYAGGIGLRYRLSKKFPMDFSIDAAINHDGEQTTYLYIGQAF